MAADEHAGQRRAHGRVHGGQPRPRRGGLQRLDHHAAVEQVVPHVRPGEPRRPPRAPGPLPEAPSTGRAKLPVGVRPPLDPPLPAHHEQARAARAAGSCLDRRARHAAGPGEGERDASLVFVGQPCDVRGGAGVLERAERFAARFEARDHPGLVAALRGHGMHPQGDLGDHPERPLGARHELPQVRPRGARGQCPGRQLAGRRRHPRADEVRVDPPEAGRGLARGPSRDAAAHRRPLVALRDMAEGEPARRQRAVGLRQPQTRPERRGQRPLVDREHAVHSREVERDQRCEVTAQRLEAADHARAAAERHDRHARLRADREHRRHLLVARRRHHRIGCVLARAGALGEQVEVRLAATAQHSSLPVVAHVRGAHDGLEPRPHRAVQRRLAQPHCLQRHRRRRRPLLRPPAPSGEVRWVLGQRRPRPRLPPAPEHLLSSHEREPRRDEIVGRRLTGPRARAARAPY